MILTSFCHLEWFSFLCRSTWRLCFFHARRFIGGRGHSTKGGREVVSYVLRLTHRYHRACAHGCRAHHEDADADDGGGQDDGGP